MIMPTQQDDNGLLAVDIGGTSVKYGYWNQQLENSGSFKTPKTWAEMHDKLIS